MTALYSLLLGAAQPVPLPFDTHLAGDGWEVIWADSRWGKEYYLTRQSVPDEGFRLVSTFGRGGARFKPWLVLHQPATGRGLALHLAWPGNWRLEAVPRGDGLDLLADTIPSGLPVIDTIGGLPLPGAVVAEFTGEADEGSRQINRFCRERLLRRPAEPWPLVMYNTWYDRWQNLSEAHLLESVAAAAEVGCELFVVDAGWYGAHDDWSRALGDWTINRQRLPNGLAPVRDAARAAGMRFGLWVEIECAHPESAVVREHPDWVLGGEEPASGRTCLDFGNPAALAWATGELDRIMREVGPDYLKMDFNSDLAVPLDQPEPLHGHYRGLAALWRHLRERYPALIVENCSSGSLRADLFIAALTDTHWVSDEVANVANLGMNLGATWLFPPEYNNHWTCNPQAGEILDLESCFTVNCLGQLGLSGDVAAWDARTRWHAADRIALYQQIRGLIARADVHHLTPTFDPAAPAGFQAVLYRDSAGPEAVLFAFQGGAESLVATVPVRGLEPDQVYRFELPTTGARQHVATGGELAGGLEIGFPHRGASAVIRLRPAANDAPGAIALAGAVGEVRWQGVDPTTLTLWWPPVDGAESYLVQLTAADGTVREEVSHAPRYVATGLAPGGTYLVRVGARQPGRFAGPLSEPVEAICASSAAASGELWREPWLSATAGWGSVRRNRSIEGLALRLGGVEHGEGIGTHAASRIVYDLSGLTGEARRFRALVGVDDSAAGARGEASTVIFGVAADGRELWRSPALRVGDAAVEVDLEVPAGTRELALLVDPAGGLDFDHADWIRPRLE